MNFKEKLKRGNNSATNYFFQKIKKRLFRSLHKECYSSISKFYGLWLTGETIRKTNRHTKKSGHFWSKIFLWIFAFNLLIYVQKNLISISIGFCVICMIKEELGTGSHILILKSICEWNNVMNIKCTCNECRRWRCIVK